MSGIAPHAPVDSSYASHELRVALPSTPPAMIILPSEAVAAAARYLANSMILWSDQVSSSGSNTSLVPAAPPPIASTRPPASFSRERKTLSEAIDPAGTKPCVSGSYASTWYHGSDIQSEPPTMSTLPSSSRSASWPDLSKYMLLTGVVERAETSRTSADAVVPFPVSPPVTSRVPSARRAAVCPILLDIMVGQARHVSDSG